MKKNSLEQKIVLLLPSVLIASLGLWFLGRKIALLDPGNYLFLNPLFSIQMLIIQGLVQTELFPALVKSEIFFPLFAVIFFIILFLVLKGLFKKSIYAWDYLLLSILIMPLINWLHPLLNKPFNNLLVAIYSLILILILLWIKKFYR